MANRCIHTLLSKGIIIILLLITASPILAQTDSLAVVQEQVQVQTQTVDFRVPDESKIEEYRNDKRFDYHEEKSELNTSWFEKLARWFSNLFRNNSNTDTNSKPINYDIVLWILAAMLVLTILFIIFKIFKIDVKSLLGKKNIDAPDIDIYTEDVNGMNFETLIANAIKNRDYRLAVRFLYLSSLKALSDKSIIRWNANKTNYSYQYEISDEGLRAKFLDVTFIFDYVWYGEFALDENLFSTVKDRMNEFNKMIANEK